MPTDPFASKASESPAPVLEAPPKLEQAPEQATNQGPSADASEADDGRLVNLERRVAELEMAVASHAAPTLGELHDNHQIVSGWFQKIRARFHGELKPLPVVSPPEG